MNASGIWRRYRGVVAFLACGVTIAAIALATPAIAQALHRETGHGPPSRCHGNAPTASITDNGDFFTNYGRYMPRMHCLQTADGKPDWPWVIGLIGLNLFVVASYLKIFVFWMRRYRAENLGDRNHKLRDLAFVFLFCAINGYFMSAIIFFWPAYRLLAFLMIVHAVICWTFAGKLKPFAIS